MNEIEKEKISVNTFGGCKAKGACLDKVYLISRNQENITFAITAPCTDYICLPVKNQPIKSAQSSFDQLSSFTLVGSDWHWELVTGKVKVGNLEEPIGVETKFGWVLNGVTSHHKGHLSRVNVANFKTSTPCLGLTVLLRGTSN